MADNVPLVHFAPAALFQGNWLSGVFSVAQPSDGERVELGADFDGLVRRYGQHGCIRGYDHRGAALLEVHQLDFALISLNHTCPPWMKLADFELLMRLVHTPQWAMLHAAGQKASKPVTGKWIRSSEHPKEHARLSRLTLLGEIGRP